MSFGSIVRASFGAVLLVNAIPHVVRGVQGDPFPTPFADPPGEGDSSPVVNVAWGAANAIGGGLLLSRGVRTRGGRVAAGIAATLFALAIAYNFGEVRAGRGGIRGRLGR